MQMSSMVRLVVTFLAVAFTPVFSEDVPSEAGEVNMEEVAKADVGEDQDTADDAKKIISQLTIAMSAEVVDERTFAIRETSKGSRQVHICLGNVGPTPRGSLDDGEYEEKKKVAKEALGKLVDKKMIWYKAAPDTVQPANASDATPMVFADVWSTDGLHISSFLKKEGHLSDEQVYETELGKDILSVASEAEKKESYKKLEEALKESEKAKQEAAKAEREKAKEEEEAENVESFGLGGWVGISMLVLLVVGVATNFGRKSNKRPNLNRKKGPLEQIWVKIMGKGA